MISKGDFSFESIADNFIGGICLISTDGVSFRIVSANDGMLRMLGYEKNEADIFFKNYRYNIIPEDMPVINRGISDVLKDDGSVEFEFRTVTRTGGVRWLEVTANLYGREGKEHTAVAVILDCTERKAVEKEIMAQYERLDILSSADKAIITDYNAKTDVMIIKANMRAGLDHDIYIDKMVSESRMYMIHPGDQDKVKNIFDDALKTPHHDSFEFRADYFGRDEYRWYSQDITSVMGQEGYVTRVLGRMTDINDSKLRELELRVRADKDALTHVYNKGAAETLIRNAVSEAYADGMAGRSCALLMMDIDNFKHVNDTLGHSKGDEVLAFIGRQLHAIFKGKDIIGRFGGDEFVILVQDLADEHGAVKLADTIVSSARREVTDGDRTVKISCSIGIAVCGYGELTYEELLDRADRAVYHMKNNGKNGYCLFGKEM